MRTAAALAVALGAVVVTTAAAAPKPHLERARSDAVEAVFTYAFDPAKLTFSRQRLVVRRDGATRFAAPVRKPPLAGGQAQPANYFEHRRSISLRDLDGDGEPEVVLDLYLGGAHCCWYTQVYRWLPETQTYRALVHVWGNFGYTLQDLSGDGSPDFVSRDDRFSYAFGSFADSRWPLRILEYRGGALKFVTRDYPLLVAKDASALWRVGRAHARENYGTLAAWAADECLLGKGAAALATLDGLRRHGKLHGAAEPPAAYLRHLRRFLRRTGYLAS